MKSAAIVGGSLAGLRAAQTLRKDGFDGTIHFIGAETHLPYDRPPLSKEALSGQLALENLPLISGEDFESLRLELHLGRSAVSLDVERLTVTMDNSQEITADGICIATGARPRQLISASLPASPPVPDSLASPEPALTSLAPDPAPAAPTPNCVFTVRTLEDCVALRQAFAAKPKRVVVVGAGFIGAEVAATARSLGLDVTLVEVLSVPLERVLGEEVGQVMADLHRDNGVDLRTRVCVEAIQGEPASNTPADNFPGASSSDPNSPTANSPAVKLSLSDGSTLTADVVVVGIGVVPNTEWLESSGVELNDGVVCDETLLAAPGVVAAGDVARWHNPQFGQSMRVEHWDNAIEQGIAAARRLLAADENAEAFAPVPWFWSDQYDRKIQLAGIPAPSGEMEIVEGSLEERRFAALYEQGGKVVGVFGMNRPRHVMKLRQLVVDKVGWEEAVKLARSGV